MKRKYEVARADATQQGLAVTVIVHEVGPTWKFTVNVPYIWLIQPAVEASVKRAHEAYRAEVLAQVEEGLWG